MEESNIAVGKRITETRKCRGYSREKLSELADISVQFLADIEKGRKSMTVPTLRRLAAALNVTTDYIVNGSKEQENDHLNALLSSLSPYHKRQAEKLLVVFAQTVTQENFDE